MIKSVSLANSGLMSDLLFKSSYSSLIKSAKCS